MLPKTYVSKTSKRSLVLGFEITCHLALRGFLNLSRLRKDAKW